MFEWLKKKGIEIVQKQCKFNINLNTKTLITIANRADAYIKERGAATEADQEKVHKAQEALLKDILLGCSNGLTLDEIESTVIQPIIDQEEVSDGTQLAISHVIKTARKALSAEISQSKSQLAESITTTFLQGKVKIESFDYTVTIFRLIENNALVSVRNDTHIRLVNDITKIQFMPYFGIIAPMTAVKVVEGTIPKTYLHEYALAHYLALRKRYHGA